MSGIEPFELIRASDVARDDGEKWLVDQLWSASAVGFIAGEPKSFKSFLSLDLALSV